MNGRNHTAAGIAVTGMLAAPAVLDLVSGSEHGLFSGFVSAVAVWAFQDVKGLPAMAAVGAVSVFLCVLGLLLPDIDQEHSTVSELLRFHIPVAHRGITHSLWVAMLTFLVAALLWRPLVFLVLGILIHDILDWPSKAGWVPFYPLGSYKKVHGTIFSRRHRFVLYSAADPGTETAFAGFVVLACVLIVAFEAYLALWPS